MLRASEMAFLPSRALLITSTITMLLRATELIELTQQLSKNHTAIMMAVMHCENSVQCSQLSQRSVSLPPITLDVPVLQEVLWE